MVGKLLVHRGLGRENSRVSIEFEADGFSIEFTNHELAAALVPQIEAVIPRDFLCPTSQIKDWFGPNFTHYYERNGGVGVQMASGQSLLIHKLEGAGTSLTPQEWVEGILKLSRY